MLRILRQSGIVLLSCALIIALPPDFGSAQTPRPFPKADGLGPTIIAAQSATFTEVEAAYERQIERIRRRIADFDSPRLPLFDKADAAFLAYLHAECNGLLEGWFAGGSLARTEPPRCYRRAYLARLRTICPLFNPMLPQEEHCRIEDRNADDEESGD